MSKLIDVFNAIIPLVDRYNSELYDTPNIVGDKTDTIYSDPESGVKVNHCWSWGYFDVIGLSKVEFEALEALVKIVLDIKEDASHAYMCEAGKNLIMDKDTNLPIVFSSIKSLDKYLHRNNYMEGEYTVIGIPIM